MPLHVVHLHTSLLPSFRTAQIAGLFDVPLGERLSHTLTAELPGMEEDWTIGAIVGPSGSGKTTLARAAYGAIYEPEPWPVDAAVIDCLECGMQNAECGMEESVSSFRTPNSAFRISPPPSPAPVPLKYLTRLLTAVGLGSVPAWLKPYRVLSTGERFRADVARAVLSAGTSFNPKPKATALGGVSSPDGCASGYALNEIPSPAPLVLDEFTSPLDRTVACTASAAIGKLLRSSTPHSEFRIPHFPRLVVLSCHTDFLPWLAPDWVLDLGRSSPQLARGSLQRPTLRLAVRRVPQALWPLFARHHYLAGGLSSAATCYAAFCDGQMHDSFNPEPKATAPRDLTSPDGCASGYALNEMRNAECGMRNEGELSPLRIPHSEFPISFCAVVAALGWKGRKRITRLVTLPEFQGLGIGPKLAEIVAQHQADLGHRVSITASHPAILGHCSRSPRWKYTSLKKTGSTRQKYGERLVACSTGRAVASFEFVKEEIPTQ